MKKTFIIIAVAMTLGTSSFAGPVSQQWIKTYGLNDVDIINCVQQTMDGGYIAIGNTRTSIYSIIDLLILKLDVNGNISWGKIYPYGTWINDAYAIQQVSDGSYIIAGFTSNVGFGAGWILNLDANGDIVWQKAYEGVVQFKSIQQTTDGGYIAAGEFGLDAQGSTDAVIVKLTSDGNVAWAKQYNLGDQEGDIYVLQTDDGGYVFVEHVYFLEDITNDICVLKLDGIGDIIWQKSYGNRGDSFLAHSILQANDGGYIVSSSVIPEPYHSCETSVLLNLDAAGGIVWQKEYSVPYLYDVKQAKDGEYTAVGSTNNGMLAVHLDSTGNIVWQKSYGGPDGASGVYHGATMDGGIIIAGNTGDSDLMLAKLDSSGAIPDCEMIHTEMLEVFNGDMIAWDTNATAESFSTVITETGATPQDMLINTSIDCYYEDPNDMDGDGVEANPGGEMLSSMQSSSFLVEGDNCADMPNGPYLGTCTEGKVGSTCIADAACGPNGVCSMNQEDTFPPLGNGIGDACDCESDFNCDADVDGSDASTFKADFGRSTIIHPCIAGDTCNGDFNCDGDVDGTDASLFKSDFGRSSMQNPCPACVQGDWCGYGNPFISGYWDSGCQGSFMEFAGGTCGEDEIVAEVAGNVIHLTHYNAFYNCCPDDIPVTVTVDGYMLRVWETEVIPGCRCMCCYTVESDITVIDPGEYTIEYCWKVVKGPCDTLTVNVAQ